MDNFTWEIDSKCVDIWKFQSSKTKQKIDITFHSSTTCNIQTNQQCIADIPK